MAPAGVGDAWGYEADLGNRDPNKNNDHLEVEWYDVFGEPNSIHSLDCIWRFSAKCFTMWKTLCYVIATTICGIPLASCWGCYFACVAFYHIWEITPSIKACEIECSVQRRILTICMEACLEPVCTSVGKLFSAFQK